MKSINERKPYPDHPTRDENEQALHDRVVVEMADRLQETTGMEVLINPGPVENHGIELDENHVLFPDILCVEDDLIRFVCEVETESTITEGALEQWRDYGSFDGANFILVVPEPQERAAQELTTQHQVDCHGIVLYEPEPAGG